jgi:hypothetical protein
VEHWIDQIELAAMTGMVVPAYFSAKPSDEMVQHLLWMTLGDCAHYVPWEHIWVVVDGDARTARLLEPMRQRLLTEHGTTFAMLPLPANQGKLGAIQAGVRALLQARPAVQYVAIRDGDGDHAAADIPALVRAARALTEVYGHGRVIVLGARHSRHHPMGWVRGELETLLDQLTLDVLAYALARQGSVLNLRHCLGAGGTPDLSSGYKVYGRAAAQALFVDLVPQLATLAAYDYWHYGPETVPVVEGLLQGMPLGQVERLTWDGQPTSSFGDFQHVPLYGELLAWVYARLEIPLNVAAQLYDNRTPALALRTTTQGLETLATLRDYALGKVRAHRGETVTWSAPQPLLPFL